jgi:hypothetical protein
MCRCAVASINCNRDALSIRFPFCETMLRGLSLAKRDWAYMCEYDTIRRIDVERLSFGVIGATSCWVSNLKTGFRGSDTDYREIGTLTMSYAHPADQFRNGLVIEDISDHPIGFALVQTALWTTGDDTTCILAAMLQQGKALTDLSGRIDSRIVQQQTQYAAHCNVRRSICGEGILRQELTVW